jgi:hypothetical protein
MISSGKSGYFVTALIVLFLGFSVFSPAQTEGNNSVLALRCSRRNSAGLPPTSMHLPGAPTYGSNNMCHTTYKIINSGSYPNGVFAGARRW